MNEWAVPKVVIAGGGASGALVAMKLLRGGAPVQVIVLEPRPVVGRGLAYSTRCNHHLMNVPARGLSLVEGDPSDFERWLRINWSSEADGETFAPRALYASYLGQLLAAHVEKAEPCITLKHVRAEAVNLKRLSEPDGLADGWRVELGDGSALTAQAVVLATGNNPPCETGLADDLRRSPHYFPSAWSPGALDGLDPQADVLLVGSGLTAVDAALALDEAGHRGNIHVVSRRGLLSRTHSASSARSTVDTWRPQPSSRLRNLLDQVRERARVQQGRANGAYDTGWRRVIEALRPDTPLLWQSLSDTEQRRFLRHLRPFWEVHRHRMAPQVGERIESLLSAGRLQILAGRISRVTSHPTDAIVEIRTRRTGAIARVKVARVINCTGAETNYRRLKTRLWVNLLASGVVDSGPLDMGLRTSDDGELVSADGQVWRDLFTLGPSRIGQLWETTAIPEIRTQASSVASVLLDRLSPMSPVKDISQVPAYATV
jgi:uncharacterized NAD(P)/FAD-binding protein YdhS